MPPRVLGEAPVEAGALVYALRQPAGAQGSRAEPGRQVELRPVLLEKPREGRARATPPRPSRPQPRPQGRRGQQEEHLLVGNINLL